jgi:hypothetical protein
MRWIFGLFIIAHGLIHASYLTPAPAQTAGGPQWPFEMSRSWLVSGLGLDAGLVRPLGAVLVALVVIAFAAAGLAWIGVMVPSGWWPALTLAGAAASGLLLALFFHPWIVLGFVIDAILLWLVLGAGWTADAAAT